MTRSSDRSGREQSHPHVLRATEVRTWASETSASAIDHVRISSEEGFDSRDLGILERVPRIRKLEIVFDSGEGVPWAALYALTELEELSVNVPMRLDLSRFSKLRAFLGKWDASLNLDRCESLRELALGDSSLDSIDYFNSCLSLESLVLVGSSLKSLEGLHSDSLLELVLERNRSAVSLRGVSGARNLVVLTVAGCKRVLDLEAVHALEYLFELGLNRIATIDTLSPLARHPALQSLKFVGTKVVDGDLGWLADLKWVGMDDRRHYSVSSKSLDAVLRPKGGGAVPRAGDFDRHQHDVAQRKMLRRERNKDAANE